MSESSPRRSFAKRLLIAAAALAAFTIATIIGSRLAVESLFKGIASSRSSGLSAIPWDVGSMESTGQMSVAMLQKGVAEPWIDAVALEKDIAQANEAVDEAERQNQGLVSTVAQAHIRLTLLEDYRAPLQANLAGFSLQLRNSLVEGVGAIFSSAALVLGVLFEFALPLLFWAALLFVPTRFVWRRFRRAPAVLPATQ